MIKYDPKGMQYASTKEEMFEYIKMFKNTLNNNDLDEFYRELINYITRGKPEEAGNIAGPGIYAIGDITKFFYHNGIDVLSLVTDIYPDMFYSETLKEVVIPSNIKSIGTSAFRYSSLKKLEFAPGCQVETIGRRAFKGCSLSGEIILPASVKSFYTSSFTNQDNPLIVKYHAGTTALSDDYPNKQNVTYEEIV